MQRDIEFAAVNGESVRKQVGRGSLNVINIYISKFPPVDDYDFRLTNPYVNPDGNKTTVTSFLFAKGEYETGFRRLSDQLNREITFPIEEEYAEQDVDTIKNEALTHAIKEVKSEREVFNGRPFFTYVLMIIQVAVFFWLELHGGSKNTSTLIKYGAKVNQLILEGEWWRFITPVFLHIGFLHLAMNTLALYYLGIAVERIFGNVRFLFIYLFAGVTGFIASFIFSQSLSAGASGAIFGCFGALLYFCAIYPKLFFRTMGMNLFIVIAINLVFGFSASGIDNAGHLGGLAGGFLAAGIVHFPKRKKPLLQLIFLILSIAVVWSSLSYGFQTAAKTMDESSTLMMAQEYVNQNDYDRAYNTLKEFEKKSSTVSEKTYFLLSYVEIKKGMLPEAKGHLQQAIKLNPDVPESYFNLALIYLEENNLDQAKVNAEKAAKLNPNQKQYSDLVQEINQKLQSPGASL